MRVATLLSCLLILPVLAGCLSDGTSSVDGTEDAAAKGPIITFTKIHTPAEMVDRLEEIGTRPGVTLQHIGDSIEGRPIHMVSVGTGGFELWVQGRIHGNEPTGAEAILLAVDALTLENAQVPTDAPESFHQFRALREILLERLTFHFIPVANPDGAAAYTRGNANGVDLNREFFAFTQPEPRLIADAFWSVKPDGCIDLHNEGIGETDWDAFNPDGPLIEAEVYDAMIDDVWLTLLEVDAAGGRGGGPNEFYNIYEDAPVVGDVINPTAYHPGTHDMFCSTRGAPGYTPEGAIRGGNNGVDDDIHAWSTRLHQVTIASAAFHWAGFYDAADAVFVVKEDFGSPLPATGFVEVGHEDLDRLLVQAVWEVQDAVNDYNARIGDFSATASSGDTQEADAPRPMEWATTFVFQDVPGGASRLDFIMALPADGEVRFIGYRSDGSLLDVHRQGTDLHLVANGDVTVRITDSYDYPSHHVGDFDPAAHAASAFNGTVDERAIVTWELALQAGDDLMLTGPEGRQGVGPYRFTATDSDGTVHMGVEAVRNAPPGANQEPRDHGDVFRSPFMV